MEYKVVIRETLEKEIFVKADSVESAYDFAKELYKNEEVVLTPDDWTNTEYEVYERKIEE